MNDVSPGFVVEAEDGGERSREPRVQSVAKAANILFAVARSSSGLRALEVSTQLQLSRQATYHLLHTLVTLGMLTKGSGNRYLLGIRIGSLVEAFPRHLAPPERLSPYVRQVAHETGETSYAAGWREGEIVTLAVARGRNAIQAAEVPHGNYGDAHARASGKLLLAMADPATRERYLDSHVLTRRTDHTIVDSQALRRELQKIAGQGFAIDQQEFSEGVSCLAVPIYDGAVPYTIGLSSPAERFATEYQSYLGIVRRVVAVTV